MCSNENKLKEKEPESRLKVTQTNIYIDMAVFTKQ